MGIIRECLRYLRLLLGDADKFFECVKINMMLLGKPYQEVIQILKQFGIY